MLENPRWKFISEEQKYALLIMCVTDEDESNYEAIAHNIHGRASSNVCKLHIRQPARLDGQPYTKIGMTSPPTTTLPHSDSTSQFAPKILAPLKDIACNEKQRVELKTSVIGEPIPKIQWFLNSKPIRHSKYFFMHSPSPNNYVLEITSISLNDQGKYSFVATNELGMNSYSIN